MSEAVLGGALYAAQVPYASVLLTVVGLAVLTLARSYFPQKGTATLIAACAMLYKFLNSPFFGCHLLGILMTGACYDLVFSVLKVRVKSLGAAATVYLTYSAMPFGLLRYRISMGTSALTLGLWAFAAVMCLLSYPAVR